MATASHISERSDRQTFRDRPKQQKDVTHESTDLENKSMDSFRTQLNRYTKSLNEDFKRALDDHEVQARENLDEIVRKHDQTCNALEAAEWPLRMSFAEEQIEVEDPKTQGRTVSVSMSQRVDDFHSDTQEKSEKIRQLWQEWSEVQYEIVCLAVEIFGRGCLEVDPQNTPATVLQMIDDAQARHDSFQLSENEALSEVTKLEAAARELSEKSIEESQQQLSDLKIGKQKKAAVISAAMKEMEEM